MMLRVALLCVIACYVSAVSCVQWSEEQLEVVDSMIEQMRAQELYLAERIRSEGQTGLKQIRTTKTGARPYYASTHSSRNIASIHNHANNIRTMGMGEFIAVINGVEFRTRHNDYSLYMPSTTSNGFHEVEQIPFPEVPRAVRNKRTVEEQIAEMRLWFKAWRDQDYSERDYRQYFKPVLCYMEGAWVDGDAVDLDGFQSDRHFIDASGWHDLLDKIRYTSESGRKDNLENFAYLPTKVVGFRNGTLQLAQWNYRVVCHPVQQDLNLTRFRAIDDVATRMGNRMSWNSYLNSQAARFKVTPDDDTDRWRFSGLNKGLLDMLMEEVPGKDNYPADLVDDAMEAAHELTTDTDVVKNAGYYHRVFRVKPKGAMGLNVRMRGFSDPSLYMAMTSNPEVLPTYYERCVGPSKNNKVCTDVEQRWTYAFPLEIIFMTPLSKWNPYNIPYRGIFNTDEGRAATDGGRFGTYSMERAFNGTNSKNFYQTPSEFYGGGEDGGDADTTRSEVGVLDGNGELRAVRASGHRVFFPDIPGVGSLRQRYPIMPIHGEGSTVFKELEALKDLVLLPNEYGFMFQEGAREVTHDGIVLEISEGSVGHTHALYLTAEEVVELQAGDWLWLNCENSGNHEHRLHLYYDSYVGRYKWNEMIPYERHGRRVEIINPHDSEPTEL